MSIAKEIVESILKESLNGNSLNEKIADNYRIGNSTIKDPIRKFLQSDIEDVMKDAVRNKKYVLHWDEIFTVAPNKLEANIEKMVGVKIDRRAERYVNKDGTINAGDLKNLIEGIWGDYYVGLTREITKIFDEWKKIFPIY